MNSNVAYPCICKAFWAYDYSSTTATTTQNTFGPFTCTSDGTVTNGYKYIDTLALPAGHHVIKVAMTNKRIFVEENSSYVNR